MNSETLTADLQTLAAPTANAAESHGLICGILCILDDAIPAAWYEHLLPTEEDSSVYQRCRRQLDDLLESSQQGLNSESLEFRLLLPDDHVSLSERVAALADWCQGFIYGMAAGGLKDMQALPADSRELIADFGEIAQATLTDNGEDAEIGYLELVEYVRLGVLLIYTELAPLRPQNPRYH